MKPIRAVLFDYGGTLTTLTISVEDLRTKCLHGIQSFLQNRGINVTILQLREADREAWRSSQLQGSLREADATEFLTQLLRRSGVSVTRGDVMVEDVAKVDYMTAVPYMELLPETLPTLIALRDHHYRMGVVSNNLFPQMLRASIERLGLKSFFDTIVASGDVGVRKPAPEIFQTALSHLGCQAEETMFVGDRFEEDIEGAKNVGMTTVWLNSSAETRRGSIMPDHEVKHLSAILRILGLDA